MPKLPNSASIPSARSTPRPRPTSDARSPMTSDSRITDPSICRRDAPIVRSVANSRVRCATVIENVLKMTNAPTKRAIAREREQEVAEDRRELVDLVDCVRGLGGRAHDLGFCRECGLDGRDELVLGESFLAPRPRSRRTGPRDREAPAPPGW